MKYSEIFYSIQGEGSLMGTPSVFFRMSFCNLRCHWCDTPYTSHDPERNIIEINQAVEKILSFDCPNVVITGGEPFLQQEALQILCEELKEEGKHITVETNGTIYCHTDADLISVSPKLSDSGPKLEQIGERWQKKHEEDRINLAALREFIKNHNYQFKFVTHAVQHIEEIKAMQVLLPLPNSHIYLMPEGRTVSEIIAKQQWVVKQCMDNNWNYTDRLHIRFWNDKRGV